MFGSANLNRGKSQTCRASASVPGRLGISGRFYDLQRSAEIVPFSKHIPSNALCLQTFKRFLLVKVSSFDTSEKNFVPFLLFSRKSGSVQSLLSLQSSQIRIQHSPLIAMGQSTSSRTGITKHHQIRGEMRIAKHLERV
jgi:hypothetical protein